jgi:hypothetical protein
MKKIMFLAIILITLLSVVLITNTLYKLSEAKQIAQKQYEAEQSAILQSEAEQNAKLQSEAEQSAKVQAEAEQHAKLQAEAEKIEKYEYEMICQHIEEASEELKSFSKKFLSVYNEYGFDYFDVNYGFLKRGNSDEQLEYKSNIDILEIMDMIGVAHGTPSNFVVEEFVFLEYPARTKVYKYCHIHSEYHYFEKWYCIFYIPDQYLNDESIAALNEFYDGTIQHVKDNLFTWWYWGSPC